MENLNAEQIKKALECCTSETASCTGCPRFPSLMGCSRQNMRDALSLIKELTEENESLEAEKEHLEKVVEGKLKRTSALEKSVLVLTEDNHILATELKRVQEENERLQERLEREAKCQYDLCGQIVDLKAENERLRGDIAKEFTCVFGQPHKVTDCPIDDEIAKAKADTVQKMQERLKAEMENLARMESCGEYYFLIGKKFIDSVAKEMLEDST